MTDEPMIRIGPPGSHPHDDRPNWQPAETAEDYMRNCREGLEKYSERHLAEILGKSRTQLWRCKMMANIPDELFDRLITHDRETGRRSSRRELAKIGHVLGGGAANSEAEHCPHCGFLLRVRQINHGAAKIVLDWLLEHGGEGINR